MENLQRSGDLTSNPDLPQEKLINYLVAEGNKLLVDDVKMGKVKDDSTKLRKTLATLSKNPYIRARIQILEKMIGWKKKEIIEMEQTGNIHNKFYDDFVHQVAILGDSLGTK